MADIPNVEDDVETSELDAGNCFPIQDGGFSYKKSFTKMNNKKLSGTVDFRLKTSVTKALLKENKCDERKLQKSIAVLTHDQNKQVHAQNYQKMNFTFHLRRKRESWHREDMGRVGRLNLPQLSTKDRKLQSASLQQVYKMADHLERTKLSVPLLPVMYGETEPKIVEYKNHTYITKQPAVYQLQPAQQQRYDKYRGLNLLGSRSVLDNRFQRLSTALSDAKLTVGNGRVDRTMLENRPHTIQFLSHNPRFQRNGNQLGNYGLTRTSTTFR